MGENVRTEKVAVPSRKKVNVTLTARACVRIAGVVGRAGMDRNRLADLDALLGRAQRDTLLRLAITHAERSLEVIEGGDLAAARAEAHGLRGAVAPLGADALVAALRDVELGTAPVTPALRAEVERFTAACRAALAS